MFYLETGRKVDCCGCRACEHICPMNCIRMIEDEEGFYYPLKNDDLCTHCGLCEKVCPNVNKNKLSSSADKVFQPKAYMAIHRDETVLAESASGGVFSAIVESYCKDNFVVFGVEFDEKLHAIHSYSETIEGTDKYRKSKYIQSDINDSYKKVERFLREGKSVLFTGTPCQIAGLRLFLRKDYDNLFCVDLVCHGVPSQKVFNDYKDYLQKKYEGEIRSFTFRHKTHTNSKDWNSRNIKAVINDKTIVMNSQEDVYLKGYHSGLFYRPACYECKYANPNRVSDVTMADFWGVEKLYPNENVHKGVSVLLANTAKGQLLVQKMHKQMKLDKVDINYVIESNAQLNRPAKMHPKRDKFYRLIKTKRFDEAVDLCIPRPSLVRRVASKILPQGIKNVIVKLLR
jgi:coenzyme F420-reducing hydrogenase beta subunit